MFEFGDIVLAHLQFIQTSGVKTRPAFVLYEQHGNIVVAGLTSNPKMTGIRIGTEHGIPKESVIKTNYLFTTARPMIKKFITKAPSHIKQAVRDDITGKLPPSQL